MSNFSYLIGIKQIRNDRRFKGSEFFSHRLEISGLNNYVKVLGAFEIQCFLHNTFGMGLEIDDYLTLKYHQYDADLNTINSLFNNNFNGIKWAYTRAIKSYSKPTIYLQNNEMYTLLALKYSERIREKKR